MTSTKDDIALPADTAVPAASISQAEEVSSKKKATMEVTEEQKEGRELVKDAYVGVAEVVFNWSKQLDEVQGNAVRAMTNMTCLTHPDHPLHKDGEDGISVFMATTHDGRQRLVFSLKQIQYIQYYIHTLRLADLAYVEYLAAVEQAGEKGEKPTEPPLVPADNVPVPLPGPWAPASDFATIEPINLPSQQSLKKMIKDVQKQNKQIEKKLLFMQPEALTPQEKSRAEADEDNNTPGPGLRRAGQREKEQKSRPPPREEGTGWGGFPIGTEQVSAPSAEIAWKEEAVENKVDQGVEKEGQEGAGETSDAKEALKEEGPASDALFAPTLEVEDAGSTDGSDLGSLPESDLANQLNKLNAFVKEMTKDDDTDADLQATGGAADAQGPDAAKEEGIRGSEMDAAEQYHHDAQQAFVLAHSGGLNAALVARRDAEYAEQGLPIPKAEDGESSAQIVAPEIGRSLFFALDLTTWEEDENVVLEVGWAASWFQEVLVVDDKDEKVPLEGQKGEEGEEGGLEEITEFGHIIVQDHLLDKRNGKIKPDNRQSFHFGSSIPLAKKDVMPHLKKRLFDAAARAGGGPVYLLLHSTDSGLEELRKLGWGTGGWETEIRPEGRDFPSYASEDGVGKVFVIDTARLFGAIENDTATLPASNKTRKSLEEVAMIMSGGAEEEAPKGCGNAGNDAAYCIKVFHAIAKGPALEWLRFDYQQTQGLADADVNVKNAVKEIAADHDKGNKDADAPLTTATESKSVSPGSVADLQDAQHAKAASQPCSAGSTRTTVSTSTTDSALLQTPPTDQDNEYQADDAEFAKQGEDGEEEEDDMSDGEFAIKGVWYTNDAGEDILLSEA